MVQPLIIIEPRQQALIRTRDELAGIVGGYDTGSFAAGKKLAADIFGRAACNAAVLKIRHQRRNEANLKDSVDQNLAHIRNLSLIYMRTMAAHALCVTFGDDAQASAAADELYVRAQEIAREKLRHIGVATTNARRLAGGNEDQWQDFVTRLNEASRATTPEAVYKDGQYLIDHEALEHTMSRADGELATGYQAMAKVVCDMVRNDLAYVAATAYKNPGRAKEMWAVHAPLEAQYLNVAAYFIAQAADQIAHAKSVDAPWLKGAALN